MRRLRPVVRALRHAMAMLVASRMDTGGMASRSQSVLGLPTLYAFAFLKSRVVTAALHRPLTPTDRNRSSGGPTVLSGRPAVAILSGSFALSRLTSAQLSCMLRCAAAVLCSELVGTTGWTVFSSE
jgi:hypothetical protein